MICAAVLAVAGCFKGERSFNRVFREHWLTQVKSLRIYGLEGVHTREYSDEELARAAFSEFDPEVLRELLPRVKYHRSQSLWKGGSLAFARFEDGAELRLRLSYYGAFFEVLDEEGSYYFETMEDMDKWDEFRRNASPRMSRNRERAQPALP